MVRVGIEIEAVEGKVYSVGRNHLGQLGLGDVVDRVTFNYVSQPSDIVEDITAGSEHVLCLTGDEEDDRGHRGRSSC